MKNNLPALLVLALLINASLVSGCGRVYTEPPMLPLARAIPHAVDFKFTNCNTCHTADQLGTVTPHLEYNNDSCSQTGCHATPNTTTISITSDTPDPSKPGESVTLTAEVKPALTTAGTPTGTVTFFVGGTTTLGSATLSGGKATLTTSAFADGENSITAQYSGDDNFDASKSTAVKHTVVDTSTITTTTTTTTTPPNGTTTTSTGNTLTLAALPLKPEFHPAAYDTLCMLCHAEGVGVQQYPLPPTWPGTPVTPGPWTIVPGSDQDHTGRVDPATCMTAACHTVTR